MAQSVWFKSLPVNEKPVKKKGKRFIVNFALLYRSSRFCIRRSRRLIHVIFASAQAASRHGEVCQFIQLPCAATAASGCSQALTLATAATCYCCCVRLTAQAPARAAAPSSPAFKLPVPFLKQLMEQQALQFRLGTCSLVCRSGGDQQQRRQRPQRRLWHRTGHGVENSTTLTLWRPGCCTTPLQQPFTSCS